jgi:hypothetical protein
LNTADCNAVVPSGGGATAVGFGATATGNNATAFGNGAAPLLYDARSYAVVVNAGARLGLDSNVVGTRGAVSLQW